MSSGYLRLLIFLLTLLILACASSSLAFCMMYSAYNLNKQGDNNQLWIFLSQFGTTPLFHVRFFVWFCFFVFLFLLLLLFLYCSSVNSYHLFLISTASVKSIPFLSFIVPIFAWKFPLVSLIFFFFKRSLVFPILLISSISLHRSLGKVFLSLLAILWNSAFRWIYISFFLLSFASLYFSTICKASSEHHFAFLHFFFLGLVLVTAYCMMLQMPVYSFIGTLSIRSNPLSLYVTSTV